MTVERWRRLEAIFYSAVEMDSTEWPAFLDQACGGDPLLRRQAESLLLSSEKTGKVLEKALQDAVEDLSELLPGQRVGAYQLVREVGRGGMGTVYLAVRADQQYQKEVAIKFLRGLSQHGALARFRSERQILADLDHPNIAHLLDGGTIDPGQPYVVMEFVDGVPIDQYCRGHDLSTADRLRLFLMVCDAVS